MSTELGDLAVDAGELLVSKGLTESEALDLVGDVLDLLTPLEVMVPGPGGVLLDEMLDQVTDRGLRALMDALRRDPAKLRARAAEAGADGKGKKAARLRRRAAEAEARQA